MTQQSEALRLADWLEDQYDPTYNQEQAAAELRRLHAENEELQKTKHYEASLWRLRRITADLLEALKQIEPILARMYGPQAAELPPMQIVRATIAKAEEEALDIARTFGAQPWPPGSCVAFARAIEAAHGIKDA